MKAIVISGIAILSHHVIEGEVVIETICRDFDHFCSLPDVVAYDGRLLAKTGWSSDTMKACYKTGQVGLLPSYALARAKKLSNKKEIVG